MQLPDVGLVHVITYVKECIYVISWLQSKPVAISKTEGQRLHDDVGECNTPFKSSILSNVPT